MGNKVNPIVMRLGVNRTWESRWYAERGEYATLLHEDLKIRTMLMKELRQAVYLAWLLSVRTKSAASPSTQHVRV